VITVSRPDAETVRRRFGVSRVSVIDNGIDPAYFAAAVASAGAAQRDPRTILFLGSLDWRPNLDAVDLLLGRVFPQLLSLEPSARLCIVGRHPPPGLIRRLRASPRVELHADVADVRPFLASCGAMAVPLRIGGGSRLKILEALASGLPVASTPIGAEGLELAPDHDLLVAELDAMPAALARCIRQPQWAAAMAARGRRTVLERYDWDVLADRLERIWNDCLRTRTAAPAGRGHLDRDETGELPWSWLT
jgi:glycosyltransferase involved in cell wall biosynthesis